MDLSKLEKLVDERTSKLQQRIEQLKISEERYHKMIDEVQDYAIILLSKEGIIQNWNKGAEKIKQYKESEAVGKSFRMFYLPEDRANRLPETLIHRAATEGRAIHEGWRLRKDQSKFWGSITLTAIHNENNEIIGFSKVTRDLTEKKNAEDQLKNYTEELQKRNDELRKSEEVYHKMIAEVQDYAIILLNEHGNIQNWNVGAEKIKGYTSAEIIGKHFSIFYTPEDRESDLPGKLLFQADTTGRAIHEGWRVRKDGTTFWGSTVISALHADDGSLLGYSKVTRDLTERKIAEDKMRSYLLELEAQNRELEQFAYIASHDLQEPLRKIQTFIEVIESDFQNEHLVNNYFSKIKSSAQRMSDLIKSVLNYSRLSDENLPMVITDLNSVVSGITDDLELVIREKNATIQSETLPVIKAHPSQIKQLFFNLIGNALKFTSKEPVIKLSSKKVSKKEMIHPPENLREGNYIQIVCADNGIGFDQKYAKIIFSMFQRLHGKHEYSGTGIGLALCKKIMDNHHGFIAAKSEVDRGSEFYVYFPV